MDVFHFNVVQNIQLFLLFYFFTFFLNDSSFLPYNEKPLWSKKKCNCTFSLIPGILITPRAG